MKIGGTIIAAHGRQYRVELPDGETLLCFTRGKKSEVACGDHVTLQRTGDQGVIEGGVVNAARVLTEVGAAMMTQMRGAAAAWSGGGLTQAMQDLKDSVGAAAETLAIIPTEPAAP